MADYLNLTAIRGEVVVQFWLRPGDAMVDLKFSGSDAENQIPGILKNF